MKKPWGLSYPLSAQRRLWSDWADAQADLSLRRTHTHFVGFVMLWLKYLCLHAVTSKYPVGNSYLVMYSTVCSKRIVYLFRSVCILGYGTMFTHPRPLPDHAICIFLVDYTNAHTGKIFWLVKGQRKFISNMLYSKNKMLETKFRSSSFPRQNTCMRNVRGVIANYCP